MTSEVGLKLYNYWRSSCAYRVRIALGLKGIEHEVVAVNLQKGEQKDEAYTTLNPSAQVPTLEVEEGGQLELLAQSMAILEYLEERYPEPSLLPRDRVARARVRQLAEIVNSGIQPLQNIFVQRQLAEHGVDLPAWCRLHIARGLVAYERVARATAGRFSVGDTPTIADCALVPQLFNARGFDIDVETELPLLAAIDAECAKLEAFGAAHPSRQSDAPAEG